MNKLETLVPPLEMCKQIPVGKFADSVYAYRRVARSLFETTPVYTICLHIASEKLEHYPAPTLAEILEALPTSISESKEKFYLYLLDTRNKPENDWQVGYAHEAFYGLYCSKKRKARDTNPATAALKLFLGMEARR